MNKKRFLALLTDIRFWLIFLFVLRLIGITDAPLEAGHNWRQSLTNMVARNFLEIDANIFYPRIDMGGEKTGIMGSEFPLLNYLTYLVASVFGYAHWYGRLINLIFCTIGIFYFYKLIDKIFNKQTAFNATIILSMSIWFSFSRKIMPDTFSIALVMIGLYYAYTYLKDGKKFHLILYFILTTLGILCKIPALSLFGVLAVTLFIKEIPMNRKLAVYGAGIISFAIVCLWYFYWVPYLLDTYQYQLYHPRGLREGLMELKDHIPQLLEKFYFNAFRSFIATAFFLAGIYFIIKSDRKMVKWGLSIITVVFIVFIIKTGLVFAVHSYYVIPFTPIMALLAGYALTKIPLRYQYLILMFISVENIANNQHDFFIDDDQKYKLELEDRTAAFIPKGDLIVINGGQSPQDMYFTHKKGWTVYNENVIDSQFMDSLKTKGAAYLIIDFHRLDQKFPQYEAVYVDEHYGIYKLD
ncbi:MAG: glycosyltransferase family 39 protein [Bacteroidia bacterium]|nr:glycosyltransferase family 39 protein [Bacteroidia bacterium]